MSYVLKISYAFLSTLRRLCFISSIISLSSQLPFSPHWNEAITSVSCGCKPWGCPRSQAVTFFLQHGSCEQFGKDLQIIRSSHQPDLLSPISKPQGTLKWKGKEHLPFNACFIYCIRAAFLPQHWFNSSVIIAAIQMPQLVWILATHIKSNTNKEMED